MHVTIEARHYVVLWSWRWKGVCLHPSF